MESVVATELMAQDATAAVSARLAPDWRKPALIRAVQRGDQDAFEPLVRSYDQSVLGLAMNLLRSPEDARDVYQEAFLRVYRNIHSFRFDCSFYTWLYRIVTNICLDHLRKRKIRKEEQPWWRRRKGRRPDLRVRGRARRRRPGAEPLEPAAWPAHRRRAARVDAAGAHGLRAAALPGLRLRTIGEILGTSEEAAKNCLFRATQKMRAVLGDFV